MDLITWHVPRMPLLDCVDEPETRPFREFDLHVGKRSIHLRQDHHCVGNRPDKKAAVRVVEVYWMDMLLCVGGGAVRVVAVVAELRDE